MGLPDAREELDARRRWRRKGDDASVLRLLTVVLCIWNEYGKLCFNIETFSFSKINNI